MVVLMAIPPGRKMHSDNGSPSASETRKSSKPIMEKRRRARINASLSELKSLLLEVIKKEGSRHSKMEKADILEMTVKHLRQLQRQQFTGSPKTDTNVLNNYRLGFNECAEEVTRYLSQMDVSDVDLRSRILNHLASCVSSGIFNPSPPTTPVSIVSPNLPSASSPPMTLASPSVTQPISPIYHPVSQEQPKPVVDSLTSLPSDSPNVSQSLQMTKVFSGVQVIPTKLQSGEFAFVLPSNVINSGGQVPSYIIPVYPQQSSDVQPNTSLPPASISTPTLISQMPMVQIAPPPLPILTKAPVIPEPVVQHPFVSAPSAQPVLSQPSLSQPTNVYRANIPLLAPRQHQPPSSTVTSQRLGNEPQPLLLPDAIQNPERNEVQPNIPRDDSMWRPW